MPLLLADANVLIDFVSVDRQMLALVGAHVGTIHVATPVLAEVDGLRRRDCAALGLVLVEPTPEEVGLAAQPVARLSFPDRICLIVARSRGMICVTNDRRLLGECGAQSIPTMRGLRLVLELVSGGHMSAETATAFAEAVHLANPHHVNRAVLAKFHVGLRTAGTRID